MNNGIASAFPVPGDTPGYDSGLTKRELLAAMMVQGMLASPNGSYAAPEVTVGMAFKYTDSLLRLANPKADSQSGKTVFEKVEDGLMQIFNNHEFKSKEAHEAIHAAIAAVQTEMMNL